MHIKVLASAYKTFMDKDGTTLLQQNARIRGDSDATGHLRFVLQGKNMSSYLRCRIAGIYVRMPLDPYMRWVKAFKQTIRNCVPWSHLDRFDPASQKISTNSPSERYRFKCLCPGPEGKPGTKWPDSF